MGIRIMRCLSTNEITKSALKELQYKGFECWRQNQVPVKGRRFIGRLGLSDINGFCKKTGKALYVEVKGKGDTLSDDQKEFLGSATKAGCYCMIATLNERDHFILKPYEL